jgi:hypothetical protein
LNELFQLEHITRDEATVIAAIRRELGK